MNTENYLMWLSRADCNFCIKFIQYRFCISQHIQCQDSKLKCGLVIKGKTLDQVFRTAQCKISNVEC